MTERAPVASTVPLVSASQINLFSECERKWGFRYLAGLKTPQHPSAALGTEVDDTQLQPYLRDGTPLDFTRTSGYIAAPGLVLLPEPKSCDLEVQKHFVLPSPSTGEFAYQGYIDLWLPRGGLPGIPGDAPAVVDFKTTGNWAYAKTPRQLSHDNQAQLYAAWALYETGRDVVDIAWTYFSTKGKYRAERRHRAIDREHAEVELARIDAVASRMFGIRKAKPNPLELAPNVEACGAFGGCPYSAQCNLSPTENIDSMAAKWRQKEPIMSDTVSTMGLLARMKAKAAAGGSAPAPAVTEKPEPPRFGTPPPATDADRAEAAARVAAMIAEPHVEVVGINPPESKLPPAPPVGSAPVPEAPAASAPVEDKKKPGRPRKTDAASDVVSVTLRQDHGIEETITVTWAEETFSPVAYNSIKIGPFTATGMPRANETVEQARTRMYAELVAFAEERRAEKLVSFKKTLDQIGGVR